MAKGVRNAKKPDSFMGGHKYPETTEIPGGWFLGQKTQLLCGLIWESFNWIKKVHFTWV